MRKYVRIFAVLTVCALALGTWTMLNAQNQNQGNGFSGGTYLTTITDANTNAFASRSVITLSADHAMSSIDSGQGGPAFQFSSQMGTWANPASGVVGRTLDFSFPSAGIARVDYIFTTINKDTASGTITLTVFGLNDDPQGSGGTVAGHFNFTGVKVTAQ